MWYFGGVVPTLSVVAGDVVVELCLVVPAVVAVTGCTSFTVI